MPNSGGTSLNYQITQLQNYQIGSGFLQLRVLLHQLFQAESWELYRELGLFALTLALIDRPLTVFRMLNFLPREAKNSAILSMELYLGAATFLLGACFQSADWSSSS